MASKRAESGGACAALIPLLLILLAGGSCLVVGMRGEIRSARSQLSRERAAHEREVQHANGDWAGKYAALRQQLDRYRAQADLQKTFASYDEAVRARAINAQIGIAWEARFKLDSNLVSGESLVGGGSTVAVRQAASVSRNSPGLLLGRRSNFIFGLVLIGGDDPGLNASYWVRTVSWKVEIERFGLNRFAEYQLSGVTAALEVHGLLGCSGPTSIVHAWRTKYFVGLVVGCEAPDGPDLPLLPYEDFALWTRLTGRNIAFPSMTYEGGLSLAWEYLDRKYGEEGLVVDGMGLPGSVVATFLPLEEANEPVLHSVIFQIDDHTRLWMPFWSVRKQLAAAQETFMIDQFLTLSTEEVYVRILQEGACDPMLRNRMLRSFQNLMNMATPYAPPEGQLRTPEVAAGTAPAV